MAKLLAPTTEGQAFRVVNHTHPEYGEALTNFLQREHAHAMLLRGTEGEPVADPRRTPQMDVYQSGLCHPVQAAQTGSLAQVPHLPGPEAAATAHYIQAVLAGELPVPTPIALQVEHILQMTRRMNPQP